MTDMRDLIRIVNKLDEEEIVDEATLYRGDSSHVDEFSLEKSDKYALFGRGIYLTDNPEVAGDYTLKAASKHTVFHPDEDSPARTPKDLIAMYLRHLMDERLERAAKTEEIRTVWHNRYYNEKIPIEQAQKGMEADIRAFIKSLMKDAKAIYRDERDNMRIVKNTMGHYVLVSKDREGYVTTFEVPDDYIERTLHAERPLPDHVLKAIRDLFVQKIGDPDRPLDMRDANGNFCTFDEWVEAHKTIGVHYAWRGADGDVDPTVGGTGENPSLDTIRNGTHLGISLFYQDDFSQKFIEKMNELGYVGLEYDGGNRVGMHVRGGGGLKHRAFVFWDTQVLKHFRRQSVAVVDAEVTPNLERGIRSSRTLFLR